MYDSLIHIIDSLKHSQVVINNVPLEKSFIEIYTPLIGVVLTLTAIIVGSIWNYKQLKNSQKQLNETFEFNKIHLKKEKKIEIQLKIIDELILVKDSIVKNMYDIKEMKIIDDREYYILRVKLVEVLSRLNIDEPIKEKIGNINANFIESLTKMVEHKKKRISFTNEQSTCGVCIAEFVELIIEIIEQEIKKLYNIVNE